MTCMLDDTLFIREIPFGCAYYTVYGLLIAN